MNYRILLIFILNAFAAAGIGAISIDVVQKMQVQGLGATWLAISASAWAIPSLVLGRRLNKLADFFDDIKITASAMAIASIVSIVYTLTTEPLVWILLQAISGATFSIFWITSEKYLSMFAKRNSTGLIFTIYAAVPVFGYTLGILIQQYSSENPNLIYYLAAGARFLTASMFLLLSKASQIDTSKIRAPDPLERCQIPMSELLGVVNRFVEHGDTRVVLCANTDNFKNNDFKAFKEKVVGHSFSLESDPGRREYLQSHQCLL